MDAVAYIRVSTDQQARSGLGLDAQRVAINRFAQAEDITLIGEYVEHYSGKGSNALDRRLELKGWSYDKADHSKIFAGSARACRADGV